MNKIARWDPILMWLAVAATVLGLLAIYDSGYARAAADGMVVPREFRSQVVSGIAALAGGILCWLLPRNKLRNLAWVAYALTVVALILVRVVGTEINGAKRWIDLKVMTIQPAEFAKLAVILVLASILSLRKPTPKLKRKPRHWAETLDWVWVPRFKRSMPLFLVLAAAGLILIEPDLATAMVIIAVSGLMMVLGGVSRGSMLSISAIALVVVTVLVVKEPYRMERILHHDARWNVENIDGIGYQTTQSEAAMAYGGLLGTGLGEGRAKHTLPAPTTDFVVTTVAEESGFVGMVCLLAIMGGLTWRLMALARSTHDRFGKLVLGGVGAWIGIQTCTNIVMANGFAPPIGVPMPFVSAGGSSLMALWMALGVCQSVLRDSPEEATEVETGRHRRWNRRTRVSRA